MNPLIENTLNIISKVTSSRQGYLLQLSDKGYKILNIWGGKDDDFIKLNELLFQLFKAGGIDTEKVIDLPTISKFLEERFSVSFLHTPSSRNHKVCSMLNTKYIMRCFRAS